LEDAMKKRLVVPLAIAALALAVEARAHFLWLVVEPGSPPTANLTFGEGPDEKTQAVPVAKLAAAKARDASGRALALTANEGGYAGALGGSPVAGASETWGVVDRGGVFLLEYYAKGASTLADASADMKLPVEIFAKPDGNRIAVSVRRGNQPVPTAPVRVHFPSGQTADLTSDAAGNASFASAGGGVYGLRSRWIEEKKGESDGKPYGEIRHYATLTFALPGAAAAPAAAASQSSAKPEAPNAAAAPAGASAKPAAADPAAYALLKGAHDSRQVMPADFPGFSCEVVFQEGSRVYSGRLVYHRKGETELQIEGASPKQLDWARSQVLNLVGHRRGGDFAAGDGKYPLQLGPDDGSDYGRLIVVNDAAQSSYRVKDNRVTEVTRTMEGSRFTISVIETMDAEPGKYIANHFVVSYRDAATGALQKVEGYRDGYARVEGVWLPTSRTILEVTDTTSPVVRTLRLRKVERLAAPPATAAAAN
jgi:hypothetical protein